MKKFIATVVFMIPSIAFAQLNAITDVNSLSTRLLSIGNLVTYFLIAIAVLFIIYNVVWYIIKGGGDAKAKSEAAMNIVWGLVGLFIIVSIWGLVGLLTNTFKTTPQQQNIPSLDSSSNGNGGGIPTTSGVPVVK